MRLWHVWARKMRDEGASLQEIADKFGKSVGTVHYALDPEGPQKACARVKVSYHRRKIINDPSLQGKEWVRWLAQ